MNNRVGLFYIMDVTSYVGSSHGMDPVQMLLTSIVSVCMHSDVPLDIRILVKSMPPNTRRMLESVPKFMSDKDIKLTTIDIYDYIDQSKFSDNLYKISENEWKNKFFTGLSFCKLYCTELFPEYDEVIYFDNDVFSNGGSIGRLSPVRDNFIVGVFNTFNNEVPTKLSEYEINTGLLGINTKMVRENDWSILKEYNANLDKYIYGSAIVPGSEAQAWPPHDQAMLNLLISENNLKYDIYSLEQAQIISNSNTKERREQTYTSFRGGILTDAEAAALDNPTTTLFIHTTSLKNKYRHSDTNSFAFAKEVYPAVVLADRIKAAYNVKCIPQFRESRNIPIVDHPPEPFKGGKHRTRNIVMSFLGHAHFINMALPTALSVMEHTKSRLHFHFLTDADGCSIVNEDAFNKIVTKLHRQDVCSFYNIPDKIDLECFNTNNFWSGLGCYFPQLSSAVLDIDDFVLFLDTDVYICRDIEDLFFLCDSFTDKNVIVTRTRTGRNKGYDIYDTPAYPLGGFFMFNPSSDLRKALSRSMWTRCQHVNDDYSSLAGTVDSEIVDVSDYIYAPEDGDTAFRKPPYAIHFISHGSKDKFDINALPDTLRHYAIAFLLNRSIVNEVIQ